jgi:hypothetical protein
MVSSACFRSIVAKIGADYARELMAAKFLAEAFLGKSTKQENRPWAAFQEGYVTGLGLF